MLSRHCAALDRDPATVEKTIIGQFDVLGDPDGFLRAMEAYAGLGVTTVWISPTGDDPAASISRITETVGQRLAAL